MTPPARRTQENIQAPMELSVTNKIGAILLLIGCCLFIGFKWMGLNAILAGVALVILGLFLSFWKRDTSSNGRDDSAGTGGQLYDDD